jgi:hypothetical protein
MHGWIDGDTKQWRDLTDQVEQIALSVIGEMVCPECHRVGRAEVLFKLPRQSEWGCARTHIFQAASIL